MKSSGINIDSLWFCLSWNWIMFQWYNIAMGACNRVLPIEPATVTGLWHLIHLKVYKEEFQDKGESHLVLSPFEYRTAVIFQALIPILNDFQTSCRINLWIWIGESVLQMMWLQLSHWWSYACIFCFHSRNVDQTLYLCLQFLRVPHAMLIKNDKAWKQ